MDSALACRFCFKNDGEMLECSRCKWTYYCSAICQKADWVNHKPNCKKAKLDPYKDSDIVLQGVSGNPTFQHSLYAVHYLSREKEKVLCVKISYTKEGYLCNIIMGNMEEFNVPSDIQEHIIHQLSSIKTMALVALLFYSDEEKKQEKIVPLVMSYNRKFINKSIMRSIKNSGPLPLRLLLEL